MSNYTFEADGSLPANNLFSHQQRYSTLRIGSVGHDNFGGGTLSIELVTEDNGRHVIRSLDALAELDNNAVIIEQPGGTRVDVRLAGSTNPDLYVEHKEFRDNESQR